MEEWGVMAPTIMETSQGVRRVSRSLFALVFRKRTKAEDLSGEWRALGNTVGTESGSRPDSTDEKIFAGLIGCGDLERAP